MPLTYWTFLLATLALSGVPFTAGFLSKDAILGGTLAYAQLHPGNWLLPIFGFGAAILTAFYMFRLVYLTFFGKFRMGEEAEKHLHEAPANMTIPVAIMAVLSLFFFWTMPTINPTSASKGWFAHLFPTPEKVYVTDAPGHAAEKAGRGYLRIEVPVLSEATALGDAAPAESHAVAEGAEAEEHEAPVEATHETAAGDAALHDEHIEHVHHQAHTTAMIISIIMASLGIFIAYRTYYQWKISAAEWQKRLGILYKGMFHKWWVDEVYNTVFVGGVHLVAKICALFDLYVIDGIVNGAAAVWRGLAYIHGLFDNYVVDGTVNGIAWFVGVWGRFVRLFQTGQLQRYIWITAVAVALFLLLRL